MKKSSPIQVIILLLPMLLGVARLSAQHENLLTASLDGETKEISIQQEFLYENTSGTTLEVLYFNDWANAYASKSTGLAKRFEEEFKKSLHLAKKEERGYTTIMSVVDDAYRGLKWERTKEEDILEIQLNAPLPPGASTKLFLSYTVQLPENKFTPYGYGKNNTYYLKDWYLTPAVYDGTWHLYSNKNLEDLYTDITNTAINFTYPDSLYLASNYRVLSNTDLPNGQTAQLRGVNQKSSELVLTPKNRFTTHVTEEMTVITDLEASKYSEISQGISINRVTQFIEDHLGKYPHEQLLVSEIDYDKNPLYGINQLPSFIRPYEEQFQFEMKFLKTALINILEETLFLDPRKEQWLSDAIANYIMIAYVEEYYPDQKLLGKLSKIWGIRSFNFAKIDFNEQYPLFYMLMARKNIDQSLNTPNDSLTRFNQKIANKYKAGLGLSYVGSYIGKEKVDNSIRTFYQYYKLSRAKILDFESILKRSTNLDINWFFRGYVTTDWKIDFKIKKVEKTKDSLRVTLKNKAGTDVPISLFGLRNDSVVSQYWFSDIKTEKTVTIPKNDEKRLVLNYDQKIPEFNQRDNWKSLGGFLSSNKKLKFTFFKDAENPYYNQVFYVPVLTFNLYDG
ncbi:MAG: metalloprotease, partial [Pricia sp.]